MSTRTVFDYKNAIGYQIYPRSFKDSNGDGIGDIQGIISKLDYLQDLGIDFVWLCPIFTSPQVDNGYDISDYENIDPMFGTMRDVEQLIAQAADRNIGVMLDLVINHTSDQHKWFQEALRDPNSPYRNYYYFVEGDGQGNPPCNWRAVFGGSVWEPVPGEDNTYYFHSFTPQQPDLNWNCPEVREEIRGIVSRWMQKGIIGFRLDVINFVKKAPFASHPADGPDGLIACFDYTRNIPGIEEPFHFLKDLFESCGCVTVSETSGVPFDQLDTFIGPEGAFSMMFEFSYTNIDVVNEDYFKKVDWTVKDYASLLHASQTSLQKIGWSGPFLENHDQPRSVNKLIKDPAYCTEGAKALAMMNLLLRGTPFIYQGEELGTMNFHRTSVDQFDDVNAHSQYDQALQHGFSPEQALQFLNERSRDNARTPFAWTNERYGGFSEATPWIAMSYEHPTLNVHDETNDPNSVLNFYKEVIAFRKRHRDAFVEGEYVPVTVDDHVVAYERCSPNGKNFTIVVNLSANTIDVGANYGTCVLNTHTSFDGTLLPYQAVVLAR